MNMQVREADLRVGEAPGARPPWWVHPFRRRAVLLIGGLMIAAAGALFTTKCGSCRASPWQRTYPHPIERPAPPKINDRITPVPDLAPQSR